MKIEKVLPNEAKEITELTLRSKAHWSYSKEQIEGWIEDLTITEEYIERSENELYKLIDSSENLIGFYAYQVVNKTDIRLNFLFVEPQFIGHRYGRLLMEDFINKISKTNFQRVLLDADPNAEKFYAKMGFKVIGQLESSIKNRFLPVMELVF